MLSMPKPVGREACLYLACAGLRRSLRLAAVGVALLESLRWRGRGGRCERERESENESERCGMRGVARGVQCANTHKRAAASISYSGGAGAASGSTRIPGGACDWPADSGALRGGGAAAKKKKGKQQRTLALNDFMDDANLGVDRMPPPEGGEPAAAAAAAAAPKPKDPKPGPATVPGDIPAAPPKPAPPKPPPPKPAPPDPAPAPPKPPPPAGPAPPGTPQAVPRGDPAVGEKGPSAATGAAAAGGAVAAGGSEDPESQGCASAAAAETRAAASMHSSRPTKSCGARQKKKLENQTTSGRA